MAKQDELTAVKDELEEVNALLQWIEQAVEGPCPLCHNACDPNVRLCHRGRAYFYGSPEPRWGW